MRYLSSSVAFACAIVCSSPLAAQTTILTASFTKGAIAEYSGNPNGTDNARLFSTLGITSMSITQQSTSGSWGGTQGNDTAVTAKITFTNGTRTSFPAAINWVKNAGSGQFDWIGLTISGATVADGYPLTTGKEKTYILQFAQSSFNMAAAVQADPNSLDGSANAGAAINALNLYFPSSIAAAPVITGPTGGAGATNSAIVVNENQTGVTTLTANKAVTWAITGGTDGAKFAISAGGVITFLAAPDYEAPTDSDTNNTYVLTVTATDSNGGTSTQTVTVTVLNVDDTLPVVAQNQSLNYAENRVANDTIGTVAATDNVAVTRFRFAATTTQTSADGFYTIDNAGVIKITAAGVAAEVANNDFEIAPNSFTYAVQAGDAANNWSAATNVTLNVTDANDAAPVITAGQSFSYAENQSANAQVGTVLASDAVGVTGFRFMATGTQTSSDGYYTVDAAGVIRITAAGIAAGIAANDYEVTPNSFTYGLQARDAAGNWSASENVSLSVTDVDDAAPVIAAGQSFSYAENRAAGALLGTVQATDAVGITGFRFASTGTSTSSDGFFVVDAAGRITLTSAGAAAGAASNDYEISPNSFSLALQARDAAANWSGSANVSLNVTNLDDTGPIVGAGQSFSYAENQAANAVVGTVAASDNVGVIAFRFAATGTQTSADGFYSVDDAGVLRLTVAGAAAGAATNDFETAPNSFTYALEAGDIAGNWSAPVNGTLSVADVNESVNTPPVIAAGQPLSYAENQVANAVIGTVAASDESGVTGFRFAVSGTQTSADGYYIIGISGAVRITAAGVAAGLANNDYEIAPNSFVYAIEAGDADGSWSPATNVTFAVTDLADTPPVITGPGGSTGATATVSVPEGTTAVTQVTANVPISSWAIVGGNDQGRFSIDAQGNVVFMAAADYEAPSDSDSNNSYVLVIEGTEANGNKATQTITVNVTNVADTPPVITGPGGSTGGSASISVPEGTTSVTQVSSSVPGSTWAITGGNDQGRFSIDAQGNIVFTAAPDYEAPADSDTNNSYVLVIEATAPDGSKTTQTVTVNVTNVADTPPVITGPGGSTGGTATISVPENTTAVTRVTSSVPRSTWAITGGNDQGRFSIDADGNIVFTVAPDYEAPTDSDTNNSYALVIEATAPDGSKTTQTVTVDVTNLQDTRPVVTGPGGSTGGSSSASVPEGTTSVATMTANVPISSWAIVGGNDQGRFTIDAQGNIRFVAAPDYERPADSDTNNSYVLVIGATDAFGNNSTQTITVNVSDVPDTPPAISGPSGGLGALASAIAVNEGTTNVTTLTANVPVTWSITGGNDAGQFAISSGGALTFVAAPNFEAPTDSDRNNSYVLIVQARDANGNGSSQTITVSVLNVDQFHQKLNEISGNLRRGLRNQAFSSLSNMLSFNEGLLGLDNSCAGGGAKRLSGGVNANDQQQSANVRYARDLSSCEARTRVLVDGGVGFSRVDGEWSTRASASLRVEQKVGARTVLGAALIGTAASNDLGSFADSSISDRSLQLNVYSRTHLGDRLRFSAFAGWGRTWYDFKLNDGGLTLDGKMDGKRHLYGAALSGDIELGGLSVTTDAILSRAVEKLGSASLDGSYAGETRSNVLFRLGKVDITRLSVPVHVPITFDHPTNGREATRLDISPGVLCQDTAQDNSAVDCGYQLGFKFRLAPSARSLFRAEARTEAIDGYRLNSFTIGFERRFGPDDQVDLGFDAGRQVSLGRADDRVMVRFSVAR